LGSRSTRAHSLPWPSRRAGDLRAPRRALRGLGERFLQRPRAHFAVLPAEIFWNVAQRWAIPRLWSRRPDRMSIGGSGQGWCASLPNDAAGKAASKATVQSAPFH
jgi:hypothetical protein